MQIQQVQFPLLRESSSSKTALKHLIGRLLLRLMPRRAAELERGEVGQALTRRDRFLLTALRERHERAGTLDRLNGLHDWLWAGEQAVRFHEQAQARFDSWWLPCHADIVEALREPIEADARYRTLCEIGCGSGIVLADVARRLPQLDHFIGLDLSAEQTLLNRARFGARDRGEADLRFESGDAADWIPAHAQAGWVYLSNAGVLEYLPEAKLRGLLSAISARGPALFAMVEPLAADHDLATETASKPYGAERSWSHHYPRLLADGGFELLWQRERVWDGIRWIMLVARTRESSR